MAAGVGCGESVQGKQAPMATDLIQELAQRTKAGHWCARALSMREKCIRGESGVVVGWRHPANIRVASMNPMGLIYLIARPAKMREGRE